MKPHTDYGRDLLLESLRQLFRRDLIHGQLIDLFIFDGGLRCLRLRSAPFRPFAPRNRFLPGLAGLFPGYGLPNDGLVKVDQPPLLAETRRERVPVLEPVKVFFICHIAWVFLTPVGLDKAV